GWVNSEVCDITSTIMFMEEFLRKKTGKPIIETNISSWRRAISGNLVSGFRPYNGEQVHLPKFIDRNPFMQQVYNASFKELPKDFSPLSQKDINLAKQDLYKTSFMPQQEPGIRDSCALGYELYVDGQLDADKKSVGITFKASDNFFGKSALGAPFNVYAPGDYLQGGTDGRLKFEPVKTWPIAVQKGDTLTYQWPLDHFKDKEYHLRVYGPNGYYREIKGGTSDPELQLLCGYQKKRGFATIPSGNIEVKITNTSKSKDYNLTVVDNAYGNPEQSLSIKKGAVLPVIINTGKSYGWYDFSIRVHGNPDFERRYAGRVETGKPSKSDPFMGRETT